MCVKALLEHGVSKVPFPTMEKGKFYAFRAWWMKDIQYGMLTFAHEGIFVFDCDNGVFGIKEEDLAYVAFE